MVLFHNDHVCGVHCMYYFSHTLWQQLQILDQNLFALHRQFLSVGNTVLIVLTGGIWERRDKRDTDFFS